MFQSSVSIAFFKGTLNCDSAGNYSPESPSFLPKATQPEGQKADKASPPTPTTEGLTHPPAPPLPVPRVSSQAHPPGNPALPEHPGISLGSLEAFDLLLLLPKPLPEK